MAEDLLKRIRWGERPKRNTEKKRTAVVPYIHKVSHGLKKIGNCININVAFSAPNKLLSLCRKVNGSAHREVGCSKKHQKSFVNCTEGVVYFVPLSCVREYVGQTGTCLNDRLREHFYNTHRVVAGHLGIHCRDCGCIAHFENCSVIGRSRDALTREIMEAERIAQLKDKCVSSPSIALSTKELQFLSK